MSHLDYFMPSAYRPVLKIKHCILRTGSVPVRPQDNIRLTPTHGDLWAGHCQQLHLLDPNQQALTLSEDASILSSVRCFHCAFAILLKATTSFVMSVCITARTEQLGSHWTDIHEIWYFSIFRRSVEKFQVPLPSVKNNGYLTRRLHNMAHGLSMLNTQATSLLLLHGMNNHANAPQSYIIRTLPVLSFDMGRRIVPKT